mmetsp:Transcript_150840/g.484768  ORF Transcript_150840/g.484768 Transcript_150840/m.484768 type:complete len:671 (-) Transcript_150840:211-2223(-)
MGQAASKIQPGDAAAAQPRPREQSLWRLCSHLTDAFTISVSVADIVTDVLVLLEFQRLGYEAFFSASAAVFGLSQFCYAFLFVASYAGHCRPLKRCAVFVAVLPFSQLVPLFTWLEALHVTRIDLCLLAVGLKPSAAGGEGEAGQGDAGDSLWGFVQSKYQSHAGFLVEAFVEAIPQAVLQTIFVVLEKRGTALNAASVGISIFTVASKGYLLSYALDYLTFFFNFACVAADCLGLFAISTTVALRGGQGALVYPLTLVSISGVVLSIVAGFALLWFTIADDHLKLRNKGSWPSGVRGVSSVFFDLYVVRVAAWFLAIVPCLVLFAGARLSLLPIGVLKSIDPDLVRHARFFRGLMHFLNGKSGGSDDLRLRLWTVNTLLARARRNAHDLEWSLKARGTSTTTRVVVKKWVADLFTPKYYRWRTGTTQQGQIASGSGGSDEDAAMQQAILNSLSSSQELGTGFASMATMAFRRSRAMMWVRQTLRHVRLALEERSEVFRPGFVARGRSELRTCSASVALRAVALISLATCLLCALPLALGHGSLIALSVIFPFFHIETNCIDPSGATCHQPVQVPAISDPGVASEVVRVSLPCGLTTAYCVALAIVTVLAPLVARRQMMWMDLEDLHGFPDPFYGGAVLVEFRQRHLRDSMLRARLGHYLAEHVMTFIEK